MSASFESFAAAVHALYRPPIRRAATARKMGQALAEFAAVCPSTADITPLAVAAWLSLHPERAPLTNYTLLRTFRAACRAGIALGLVERDPFGFRSPRAWFPAGALEAPDAKKHHPAADIARALALADREVAPAEGLGWPREWRARRLRALAYLAAYTGARRNELLGARLEDLDLPRRILHLRPNPSRPLKTAAARGLLPIAEPAAERLGRWILQCGSEWLFPGSRLRRPWLGGLSGYRPGDQLRQLGERAGVRGLTFQSLRHSFATLSESWGLGELELQRILRHSRASTQRGYRHCDVDQLRSAVARVVF